MFDAKENIQRPLPTRAERPRSNITCLREQYRDFTTRVERTPISVKQYLDQINAEVRRWEQEAANGRLQGVKYFRETPLLFLLPHINPKSFYIPGKVWQLQAPRCAAIVLY